MYKGRLVAKTYQLNWKGLHGTVLYEMFMSHATVLYNVVGLVDHRYFELIEDQTRTTV